MPQSYVALFALTRSTYSEHLRGAVKLTEIHRDIMPVEHARTVFKLSEALLQANHENNAEAKSLREEAETYLKSRKPDALSFSTEDAYDSVIPIFWR